MFINFAVFRRWMASASSHTLFEMTTIAAKFGRVLRAERERRGLSQEALAELADLNRSFLGDVERGTAQPSIETLQKLADALGESLSNLIKECEKNDPR
jgi:XRE family transcriptional regulator, regulator of sulfur utilization